MGKLQSTVQRKMTDQQRIAFAEQIEVLYEAAHADAKKVFGFAFLKGIATGLGVFLGGTLIVALLLWLLSLGTNLPFVGKLSQAAEKSIQQTKDANQH